MNNLVKRLPAHNHPVDNVHICPQCGTVTRDGYQGYPSRKHPVTNGRIARMDPSRTITLRRQFQADLSRRFNKLRQAIVHLILHDDALGLKQRKPFTFNAFCPTGEGGGVDPTCSPSKSIPNGSHVKSGKDFGTFFHGGKKKIKQIDPEYLQSRDYGFFGQGFYMASTEGGARMYGSRISKFKLAPDAKVLVSELTPEKSHPDLAKAISDHYDNVIIPKAEARGKGDLARGEKVESFKSAISWKNAVNAYGNYHDFDVIMHGSNEVVVRRIEKVLTVNGQVAFTFNYDPDQARDDQGQWTSEGGSAGKPKQPQAPAIKQTETPEFKQWFGDSKVVDEKGEPLVVYHGTASNVVQFDPKLAGKVGEYTKLSRLGTFFAKDPDYASQYADAASGKEGGQNVMPVYIHVTNPYETTSSDWNRLHDRLQSGEIDLDTIKSELSGYDGIHITGYDDEPDEWAVFSPTQIKSASGNRGTFDPKDPIITHAEGRWQFHTAEQKLTAFREWIKRQIILHIVGEHLDENAWWNRYIMDGFRRGAARAFDDTRPQVREWQDSPEAKQRLDFYNGTREEFLRSSFNWPTSREKVKLLASRTFTDLKGVTDGMAARISHTLVDGLTKGDNPRVIARELARAVNVGKVRSQAIARTEIIRTHAEGQLQAFVNLGVTEVGVMAEWLTAEDSRVCPQCKPLDGMVMKVGEATGLLPRHPNCLIGSTPIQADGLVAAMKAFYTGDIFRISTASGGEVSVTSNHIFLTEFGFVPAHLVYKGLNFLDARRAYAVLGNPRNSDDRVSLVQDVFQTLAFFGHVNVARREVGVYLHGDGQAVDSEISIVRADSILGSERYSSLSTKRIEEQLPSIKFGHIDGGLSLRSPLTQFLEGIAFAFDSSMGGFREILALLLGRLLHAKYHRLAPVSRLNPSIVQSFIDGAAAAPEAFRECLRAHPILKQLDDFSLGDLQQIASGFSVDVLAELEIDSCFGQMLGNSVLGHSQGLSNFPSGDAGVVKANGLGVTRLPSSPKRHARPVSMISLEVETGSFESGGNGGFIDPEHFADLGSGFARLVKLDEVVDVKVEHVCNLPVYDVETQSSLIIAGNITQSQCRCCWTPANVGEDESKQKRTKGSISKAIDESYEAEAAKDRSLEETKERSSWGGADKTISKARPQGIFNAEDETGSPTLQRRLDILASNSFCPTGEGRGVDPSCSPNNKGAQKFIEEVSLSSALTPESIDDFTRKELKKTVTKSNYIAYRGIGVIKERVSVEETSQLKNLKVGDPAPSWLTERRHDSKVKPFNSYTTSASIARRYREGAVEVVIRGKVPNDSVIADLTNLRKLSGVDQDTIDYGRQEREIIVEGPINAVIHSIQWKGHI